MQNSSIFVFGMSVSSVIIPDSESDIPFPIWLPRPKTGNVVIPETPVLINAFFYIFKFIVSDIRLDFFH